LGVASQFNMSTKERGLCHCKNQEGYAACRQGDYSKSFVWHDGPAGFLNYGDVKVHLDHWTGERFYTEYPKEKMLEALLLNEIMVHGKRINTIEA